MQKKLAFFHKSLLAASTIALVGSCGSPSDKTSANGNNAYYPTMNDSVALSSLFKSVAPDADFLAKHQVRVLAGVWNAPSVDSVKTRYPKAQLEGSSAEPIMVYYTIDNTTKEDSLYRIDYSAHLASSNKIQGEIGFNSGVAVFTKSPKGWHLKSNVYNPESSELRGTVAQAVEEPSSNATVGSDNANTVGVEQRIEKLERDNEHLTRQLQTIEARFERDEAAINRVGRIARDR